MVQVVGYRRRRGGGHGIAEFNFAAANCDPGPGFTDWLHRIGSRLSR